MPTKEMDLMSRKKVALVYAKRYRRARCKKEKSQILDEFIRLTGYNRCYASWLLRNAGKKLYIKTPNGSRLILVADPTRKIKRKRAKIYDEQVQAALKKIWEILDYPASLRLAAMLPEIIPTLERHGELLLKPSIREKLLRISRSTIDRLLAKERKALTLKPRAKTKPGSLLKRQIPIRTHSQWNENIPGFLEIDLLSHDGGSLQGEFAYTLVLTDIHTQWTELVAVKGRAQRWTFQALQKAMERFPFPIRGIDSDNDSAFINHHLLRWCRENGIVFTRSRPYWKNDNCHVEQKNWSVGRRYLGYFRYDTPQALEVLQQLGEVLSLYVNYFQPSVKLKQKIRVGGKVKKIYEPPKTPYKRVVESDLPQQIKKKLEEIYQRLNPAELHRKIVALQEKLFSLATPLKGVKYEI